MATIRTAEPRNRFDAGLALLSAATVLTLTALGFAGSLTSEKRSEGEYGDPGTKTVSDYGVARARSVPIPTGSSDPRLVQVELAAIEALGDALVLAMIPQGEPEFGS